MVPKPGRMAALALERFGGIEQLRLTDVPIPELAADEVRIRVRTAGVGEWDAFEREGGFAEMQGTTPAFPYVLGSEGAGTVVAIGRAVRKFAVGDRVYAVGFLNPKGGFYAELAVVPAAMAGLIPRGVSDEQAAAMGVAGITALRGLHQVLGIQSGDALAIMGASGGIGHVALQLAKRRGARVLAVASGSDGVWLAKRLGADAAIDGRSDDILAAARAFAPDGLDAALVTAGGEAIERALQALKRGGRAAVPNGVEPQPKAPGGVRLQSYDGEPEPEIFAALHREISERPLDIHVARTFPLERAAAAHRALDEHYLGKLVLQIDAC